MKNILVIGDTILDRYVIGGVGRISPEAPVPVLQREEYKENLGGACNVAANIKSLSPKNFGVDYYGFASMGIVKMLQEASIKPIGISVSREEILTKTRYVCEGHQLLRVDKNVEYQKRYRLVSEKVIKNLDLLAYDIIVVSDYGKGSFTEGIMRHITENFSGLILVDLKRLRNWITDLNLSNCIVKCNQKEYEENRINQLSYCNVRNIVVTLGKYGYKIYSKSSARFSSLVEFGTYPTFKIPGSVSDPVGAGDTFLAGMASSYCVNGFDIRSMCATGNKAAAIRVSRFGKLVVTQKEMNDARRQ